MKTRIWKYRAIPGLRNDTGEQCVVFMDKLLFLSNPSGCGIPDGTLVTDFPPASSYALTILRGFPGQTAPHDVSVYPGDPIGAIYTGIVLS